jgi:hypothetical protein
MNDAAVPKNKVRTWVVVVPVAALGLLMLALGAGFVGLYLVSSDAAPFRLLARTLPFPAAAVDGQYIRYSEWSDDTRAFVALAEQGQVSIPGAFSRHDIAKNVMDRLIRNRLLERLARERGIEVSADEVDKEYGKVAADSAEQKLLGEMLKALGWSDRDVKEQIVRPYLLGRRLSERLGSVAAADQAVADALQKANVKIYVKY